MTNTHCLIVFRKLASQLCIGRAQVSKRKIIVLLRRNGNNARKKEKCEKYLFHVHVHFQCQFAGQLQASYSLLPGFVFRGVPKDNIQIETNCFDNNNNKLTSKTHYNGYCLKLILKLGGHRVPSVLSRARASLHAGTFPRQLKNRVTGWSHCARTGFS